MPTMTHEYSIFPERVYELHNFENVANAPSNVLDIITEIKTLVANGEYNEAEALLKANKSILLPYWIDAGIINGIEEEIRNLEIFAKGAKQAFYYQTDEPDAVKGDIWIY